MFLGCAWSFIVQSMVLKAISVLFLCLIASFRNKKDQPFKTLHFFLFPVNMVQLSTLTEIQTNTMVSVSTVQPSLNQEFLCKAVF